MIELFKRVLNEYLVASQQDFKDHPLGTLIKDDITEELRRFINDQSRYTVKGSIGMGRWSFVPWLAIFDNLITSSAQSGYYPVFLFQDDMRGFYFSLNQGVTDIITNYGELASEELRLRAKAYQSKIDSLSPGFSKEEIKVIYNSSSRTSKYYEDGNIISKYYESVSLPSQEQFERDILEMLRVYHLLFQSADSELIDTTEDGDDSQFKGEERRKFRFHKRIERNSKLVAKVKSLQGYTCKVCGLNLETMYGELGKHYIEAHHLTPLSELKEEKVELDARKDFTVLCANCHRMAHRLEDPSDISLLKSLIHFK